MKQLFSFLNMQFVLKYLWIPGCKHSISVRNFAEASILHKSAPLHDGKILIFLCGTAPSFNLLVFIKSQTTLFGHTCKNAEYSWWDRAHLLQGSLVNDNKPSADRSKQANNFIKFKVPIYSSSLLTRFKPSEPCMMMTVTQQMATNTKKLRHFWCVDIQNCCLLNWLELEGMVTWWFAMCYHTCMPYPVSHYLFLVILAF